MEKIEELIIRYFDAVDSGKSVDIKQLIEECPAQDREELMGLIKTTVVIQNSVKDKLRDCRPDCNREKQLKDKISKLQKEMFYAGDNSSMGIAARSGELDVESQKNVQNAFDEIRRKVTEKGE